jgi:8-oxo-dGTP pyrophosphatase MutT (NUDIX family)
MNAPLQRPRERAWPTGDELARKLAMNRPLADLLTADDLEKQQEAAKLELRAAAVLLLIVNRAPEPTVVFTQRTTHLADHAGQISFPGGRHHPGDRDAVDTALREANEEIGLERERVRILGRMPEYRTVTAYAVTPVVGWIEPPLEYHPDPHEVDAVFEVPLAFLLDRANHRHESAFFKGRMRKYWAIPFGDRYIWGATAGMLVTFQRIVGADP